MSLTETFMLNDPPGAFRVIAADGTSAFDSRLSTQRIHMTGTLDLTGPANTGIISTTSRVNFGKTFAVPPYVKGAGRMIDANPAIYDEAKHYYIPRLGWSKLIANGLEFYSGFFHAADTTGVTFGNAYQSAAPLGRLRWVFGVFDNAA